MRCLSKITFAAAILLMVAIGLLIFLSATLRVFGVVVPDANNIAGMLFVVLVFLGLAETFLVDGHIRVNLVISRFSPPLRLGIEVLTLVIGMGLAAYVAYALFAYALNNFRLHVVSSGMLAVPLWLPQACIAFGMAVLALVMAWALVRTLQMRALVYERDEDMESLGSADQ